MMTAAGAGQDLGAVSIEPSRLEQYTAAIFEAAGATAAVASRLAHSLVDSNQAGHDSHGVIRIPQYLRSIREGVLDPRAEPSVLRDGPAWALIDGRWGFGHEAARFSMATAIDKASHSGVGLVSAVRCNHIGRLGEWTEQAAEAGMVGFACVSLGQQSAHLVAPFGGAAGALGTNPLSFGVPRQNEPPLLLDWATSVTPEGKVRVARDKGVQLPPGSLIDKNGQPSTDPNALYEGGALLPLGGHKGYALSVMIDVLGLALGGADQPDRHGPRGANSGSCYLAINPAVFRPPEDFEQSVERIAARLTAVPPAPGFEAVLLPGDPEHRTRAERATTVLIPQATWTAIAEAAQSVGVSPPA
jgi:uncharacterized oxidoreductase